MSQSTPASTFPADLLAEPESVGLSRAQLTRIDDHLRRRYLEPRKIAGALTLVARGGKVAWLSPLGSRDLERDRPMEVDTLFRIYSMTKPVTSVALMMLHEAGAFQLGDRVSRFLPQWRDLKVYESGSHPDFITRSCEREMTVRDLMTHQSGLTYGFMERTPIDAAYRKLRVETRFHHDLGGMVDQLAELPLEFSPGTKWNYSVSTDILGRLVEVISGQCFDRFLEERIFEPLGMKDTSFHVPESQRDRFAANYHRDAQKRLVLLDDPEESPFLRAPQLFSGGGGLISTAHDYFRFCQMLLDGGVLDGTRILGRKTIELMTMNHLPGGQDLTDLAVGRYSETTYDGIGFGLGFAVTLDLARSQNVGSVGEYFWGGAASTAFWVDPSEELVVIFLTQFMPSGTFNFRGQLRSIVYPALVD